MVPDRVMWGRYSQKMYFGICAANEVTQVLQNANEKFVQARVRLVQIMNNDSCNQCSGSSAQHVGYKMSSHEYSGQSNEDCQRHI